ncbi:N-acetylmuramoyl-L-alanine amidase [Larsenimonas suaedae]|uniref:N-acetylmuramoyl-L-alanine amidase n=1 Tax=Larsenimonas suaedae TaxID=1851019 RepID=A0ABU1GWD6_9GAMM|nr:N-acetylmuramoyl-L-alanine amidase [Larsenimonas suaedae]MCM2973247.1 N-acetylmuramoyl-L-alanine amidase [Larsenimonas suaedae]MDR5896140.1 N-acetylmuramoyl-L-alanine amidase [Larsenimonas suaedae]
MLYSLTRPASLIALVALITGCASSSLTLPTEWHPYQAPPLLAPGPPDRLSQSHPLDARAGYLVDHHYPANVSNSRVRFLVLHFTSDDNAAAFRALQGPNVSVHYLITRSPERRGDTPIVLQMVPESRRAWHAGVSAWQGRTHLNDSSIGIEIVNEGPREGTLNGWAPYSVDQINAVIALARDISRRYGLDPTAIVGHSDIAPTRKVDPGPAFPWYRLYRAGIGAWPNPEDVDHFRARFEREPPSLAQFLGALSAYGYAVSPTDRLTDQARAATRAFQMHFRPADYSGEPDTQTAAILWALLERYRPEALPR